MVFAEHERVVLIRAIPAAGLTAGTTGTVVGAYGNSGGYEVEFTDPDGHTIAVVTLDEGDIRPFVP